LKIALQRAWLLRGWLARLLWPLSQIYGLTVRLRRWLYRHHFLASTWAGVPTIVVGNVISGGAGKTPLVIYLVGHLRSQGFEVGVISRGFGRTDSGCREVLPDTPVYESGDEPALIKRTTGAPVFVAKKRYQAAMALLTAYPKTQFLVCDDGLQHYALARDLEIAVFDDRGIGNGWLLPAGPLREPWPERLRQGIDLVLHTGTTQAFDGFRSTRELADYAIASNGSKVPLSSLAGQKLVAIAGIANPEAFFSMLRCRGLTLDRSVALPDHYNFADFQLPGNLGNDARPVLCTEKDAVKVFGLPAMNSVNLLAVPLQFLPEPSFVAALDALLKRLVSELPSRHGHKTA
jgi:tetraacyldisaccharide 4'-kinase